MINKDFLKEVLNGKKKLFPLSEVKWINVPMFDELAVKNIFPLVQGEPAAMEYFPSKLPNGRLPDREYFWNVMNTGNTEYVTSLIKHANE